jgi:hypothetical protein
MGGVVEVEPEEPITIAVIENTNFIATLTVKVFR